MKIAVEKIWNAEGIEVARNEFRSQDQVINEAIKKANETKVNAETEIKNLEENILPGLLVEQFFGKKILKIKIEKIKERRAELLEIIDDLPLLLKGFKDEQWKIGHKFREVEKRERYVQKYERAKTVLKEKYSLYLGEALLRLSKILDCEADAQKFLEDLRTKKPEK